MRRGTNLPAVGGFNQSVVLDMIRRSPSGISRAEIAERTGLAPQTISNASKRLQDEGLVVEAGTLVQGRGKPPVMLRLRSDGRFAVGVHLDPAVITYVVADLAGGVVAHAQERTPAAGDPDAVIADIAANVRAIVAASGVEQSLILGVGIAAPGPIDARNGVVVDPPLLDGWRDVPLRDALAEAIGMPVLLEKDVNAAAVAEVWVGPDDRRDFGFFYLGTGIGIGLVLEREVLRGSTGNAGEGGTIVVPSVGLPPHRPSEQLGHLATPRYLVAQALDEGVLPPDTVGDVDARLDELLRGAADGGAAARGILERAGRMIGASLVTLVNLLDLAEIVFGGPYWERMAPFVRPEIDRVLRESPDRKTHHPVVLADASVGDDVTAVGAACLVLDAILTPRASSLLITG